MRYLIFTLLLIGCAGPSSPELTYTKNNIPYPALESFPHCRSYGCKKIDIVSLSEDEQSHIHTLFQTNDTPEQERDNIRNTIAYLETTIGAKTGTSVDVGGTYVQLGHMQQDCIDESTNTTTYLLLLEQMDLLKFHDVNALTSRPPLFSGWLGPHRSAVIHDKTTHTKYVVDSWFFDNGVPPKIMKLDHWKWRWQSE